MKSDRGRAIISAQFHDTFSSTRPSIVNDHVSVDSRGVASAVSTGQSLPASYWPGGSRGSRARRPLNPRVKVMAA